MNAVEQYVHEVMHNIQAHPRDRARIEADLRAHLEEALEAGALPAEVIRRMGSPESVAEEFMAGFELRYASIWRRLAAFVVDVAVLAVVAVPLVGLGVLLANLVPANPEGGEFFVGAVLIAGAASLGLIASGAFILYFPIMEGRFGQTVGKRWLGLHVVKESGLSIGYKEAFLRRLSFYFDFLVVDALFIFFTAKRQRAMDIVARTVVIRE